MKLLSLPSRTACNLSKLRLFLLLSATALGAASPALSQGAAQWARQGTPTFLSAVDMTLRLWSAQAQKWGLYVLIGIALVAAYLTGLIVFQILFASGTFAPPPGSVPAWFSAVVLLVFGLLMLPATWPWWAPYAFLALGLAMFAVLISSFSKKAA